LKEDVVGRLPLKEVEKLGYYDFMSYVGVPFFHMGGEKSSLRLAKLSHIEKGQKVLMVGCGTGFSACLLAKRLGCYVTGIDIAAVSIDRAKARAKREHIEDKVEFRVGDANSLPFEANTFDVVITEFVAMFLDKTIAFKEFVRVLKPGGYVGIYELFKDQDTPSDLAAEILGAEQLFQEITNLEFKLCTQADWVKWLGKYGLINIQLNEYRQQISTEESPEFVRVFEYLKELLGSRINIPNLKKFKYLVLSKTIRKKFENLKVAKRILFRDRTTARYVGRIFGVGQKAKLPET
jgi:ubiquinone/menaquinone biosynthesis C-methylase UbiE